MLSTEWNAASWKAVAKYYRDLWIKTVDDVVAAEDELSELRQAVQELDRLKNRLVQFVPKSDESK